MVSFIPIAHFYRVGRFIGDATAKYFSVQARGTVLFLFGIVIQATVRLNGLGGLFILIGLMVKGGLAPFHRWFPHVALLVR